MDGETKLIITLLGLLVAFIVAVGVLGYRYPMRMCCVCGRTDYDGRMNHLNFGHIGDLYVCDDCGSRAMTAVMREGDR